MNVTLNNLTVKQLLIAAGLARSMKPDVLAFHTGVTTAYISKLVKDSNFKMLVIILKNQDIDDDNKKFINIGTLYADIGKYMYNQGLKTVNGDENEG